VSLSVEQIHPAINAVLNLTSFAFLIAGRMAIARNDVPLHRKRMLSAFAASTIFLISYLLRYATSGTHKYPGSGWDKTLYLIILFSHMALSIVL
jgi:putative membrane protein